MVNPRSRVRLWGSQHVEQGGGTWLTTHLASQFLPRGRSASSIPSRPWWSEPFFAKLYQYWITLGQWSVFSWWTLTYAGDPLIPKMRNSGWLWSCIQMEILGTQSTWYQVYLFAAFCLGPREENIFRFDVSIRGRSYITSAAGGGRGGNFGWRNMWKAPNWEVTFLF